jgi:3-dehydroquinate synthase
MPIKRFTIKSNLKDYEVLFLDELEVKNILLDLTNSLFIIDYNVWSSYNNNFLFFLKDKNKLILKAKENLKSFKSVFSIYEKAFEMDAKKNINLVAIGGGIIQDIVGFAASTLYRGINWYYVPTTSLSQVDSCIGGKTSLNYKKYKNLIGTFYPPSKIFIYTHFLKTLPKEYYYSGIGEMIKLFIIAGHKKSINIYKNINKIISRNDSDFLLKYIIDSLCIKKSYIEKDELDKGIRNYLNYGHCFGHALEGAINFKIPHGIAVVFGIMIANKISFDRQMINEEEFSFINRICFPLIEGFKINGTNIIYDIIDFMKKDKKRTGKDLPMVLIDKNYNFKLINDIKENEVINSFNYFINKEIFL